MICDWPAPNDSILLLLWLTLKFVLQVNLPIKLRVVISTSCPTFLTEPMLVREL